MRSALPVAFALALSLAGCTTTEIDAGEAEAFIRENLTGAERVDCPEGVESKAGDTFECRAEYADGRRATVTVHIRDDEGRIAFSKRDVRPAR
jgi:hypothetical protein